MFNLPRSNSSLPNFSSRGKRPPFSIKKERGELCFYLSVVPYLRPPPPRRRGEGHIRDKESANILAQSQRVQAQKWEDCIVASAEISI